LLYLLIYEREVPFSDSSDNYERRKCSIWDATWPAKPFTASLKTRDLLSEGTKKKLAVLPIMTSLLLFTTPPPKNLTMLLVLLTHILPSEHINTIACRPGTSALWALRRAQQPR
jgi:hypothetical protein